MKRLPIGIQTFCDIVLNDYLYVDKLAKNRNSKDFLYDNKRKNISDDQRKSACPVKFRRTALGVFILENTQNYDIYILENI